MKYLVLLFVVLILFSCKEDKGISRMLPQKEEINNINKYAEGFSVKDETDFKILIIKKPWTNSNETFRYVLVKNENKNLDWNSKKNPFNAVIKVPIKRIVVTSTTHIPALELLGVEQTLVGFPGTDYISSEKTRKLIDAEKIRELGNTENLNTEVLLELNPDVVIGFGVNNTNKSLTQIEKAGVPVIYNGDWVEKTPLAKAEWIKFFGALFNKEKEADSIFNTIEKDYLDAKKIASKAKTKPTVLSGAMHKDIWYLPSGTSSEAQLLKDANASYLWSETKGSGSLSLSSEAVFEKGSNADLWLSPSYYKNLEALEKANSIYTEFSAFKNKNVYSFSNSTGKTGGVLYYELGMSRPDLVLKDLIKICHPELQLDYEPFFFKALE